jgi:hypothetical protein
MNVKRFAVEENPVTDTVQWLLNSDEPWTRYRTLVDLLDRPEDEPGVQAARGEMVASPQVQALISPWLTFLVLRIQKRMEQAA